MWAMCSSDHASVKAQTTVGKLQELCALALAEQWSRYYFVTGDEELTQTAFLCDAEVLSAHYEDLQNLLRRLARRIVKDTKLSFEKRARWENLWVDVDGFCSRRRN